MRKLSLAALSIVALSLSAPAGATTVANKWASGTANILLNPWTAFLRSAETTTLQNAIAMTYNNPSYAYLTMSIDDDYSSDLLNGESESGLTNDSAKLCGAMSDGCAYVYLNSSGNISEADVFFNSVTSFDNTMSKSATWGYGGASRPLFATGLHEFGHALGLSHTNYTHSIMGTEYTYLNVNGNTYTSHLGEDASYALRAAYGTATGWEDLSLSHWRYSAASGEYTVDIRTRFLNSAGAESIKYATSPEPVYLLGKGAVFTAEATLENNGSAAQYATIRYYLSADSTITTGDTLLATKAVWTYNGTPDTINQSLTLPKTLVSGQTWFVGAIVDPLGSIAEYDESNNAIYLSQIRVF
jgi:hypothetical protein